MSGGPVSEDDAPVLKVEFASPDGVEWLWAKPVEADDGIFLEVTNIPFKTRGLGLWDLVGWDWADEDGDEFMTFNGTIHRASGYKTFAIDLADEPGAERALKELREQFALEIERADGRSVAVAFPPHGNIDEFLDQLEDSAAQGAWTYERRS